MEPCSYRKVYPARMLLKSATSKKVKRSPPCTTQDVTMLHCSGGVFRRYRSPHNPEPLVEAEFLVGSHNWDVFAQGLGNDLAVEWVAMVQRQIEQMQRMISGVGQDSKPEVGDAREYFIFADSQLSYRLLDGNFRE